MKTLKLTLSLIVSLTVTGSLWAKGAGSSAGLTLLQPVSAKVAGMNGAYTAMAGDIFSLHYNPAGLALLKGSEMSAMYQEGLDEDNTASLLYGIRTPIAVLGVSVLYYDTGKIEMYDTNGVEISKVGQRDVIATVGAARFFSSRIAAGLAIKGISSEIFGESASAVAADAGVLYVSKVNIGLAVQNMGTGLKYISETESLPQIVRLGLSHKLLINKTVMLNTAVDFPHYLQEEESHAIVAVDATYNKMISLRGGYNFNLTDSSREDEQKIAAGVGFQLGMLSLDYAIGIAKNLDMPHHVSIKVKF